MTNNGKLNTDVLMTGIYENCAARQESIEDSCSSPFAAIHPPSTQEPVVNKILMYIKEQKDENTIITLNEKMSKAICINSAQLPR